jgi:AAA domain
MSTEDEIDLQVIEMDKWREQKPGVQVFLRAVRQVGQDDPLDGPRAIIPGVVSEGQTAICPGAPGTGKTFAILNWCARIAKGGTFLGQSDLCDGRGAGRTCQTYKGTRLANGVGE